jgi:hypothetical protein
MSRTLTSYVIFSDQSMYGLAFPIIEKRVKRALVKLKQIPFIFSKPCLQMCPAFVGVFGEIRTLEETPNPLERGRFLEPLVQGMI